jgi:hypothetical protein
VPVSARQGPRRAWALPEVLAEWVVAVGTRVKVGSVEVLRWRC